MHELLKGFKGIYEGRYIVLVWKKGINSTTSYIAIGNLKSV